MLASKFYRIGEWLLTIELKATISLACVFLLFVLSLCVLRYSVEERCEDLQGPVSILAICHMIVTPITIVHIVHSTPGSFAVMHSTIQFENP